MALTIIYEEAGGKKTSTFYMGSKVSQPMMTKIEKILWVTADGHELTHILTRFRNLPCLESDKNAHGTVPRGYVMTWYGDHAKFITDNWD